MPNVTFFFNHKLTGADFKKRKAWFEVKSSKTVPEARDREVEIEFDFLIGADGAHSAARYHMMKFTRMDYQQRYIDTLWCEFTIEAKDITPTEGSKNMFRISPHHLHIWPGKEFMFIAIPSFVRSLSLPFFDSLMHSGRILHMHSLPSLFAFLSPRI
jgi:kynurenine 3-monooxygenase